MMQYILIGFHSSYSLDTLLINSEQQEYNYEIIFGLFSTILNLKPFHNRSLLESICKFIFCVIKCADNICALNINLKKKCT